MDYEKKYTEALGWMQSVYPTMTGAIKEDAEHYFPELKEMENERIRKSLIHLLQVGGYMPEEEKAKAFAWLEKQGEQEPTTIDIDKMVDDYANNKERGNEEFGKPVNCMIRAYRQGLKDAIGKVVLKPTWSEEDEEHLNSIISDIKTDMGAYPRSQEVIDIYNDDISFLKSLRDRVQPQQKQEWSEEDEDYYDAIIAKLEVTQDDAGLTDNQMEFLKSIKQRIGG